MNKLVGIVIVIALGLGGKLAYEQLTTGRAQEMAEERITSLLTIAAAGDAEKATYMYHPPGASGNHNDMYMDLLGFLSRAGLEAGIKWEIVGRDDSSEEAPIFTVRVNGESMRFRVPYDSKIE